MVRSVGQVRRLNFAMDEMEWEVSRTLFLASQEAESVSREVAMIEMLLKVNRNVCISCRTFRRIEHGSWNGRWRR